MFVKAGLEVLLLALPLCNIVGFLRQIQGFGHASERKFGIHQLQLLLNETCVRCFKLGTGFVCLYSLWHCGVGSAV